MRILWIPMVFLGFILAAFIPAASQDHDEKQSADIAAIRQVSASQVKNYFPLVLYGMNMIQGANS